MKKAIQTLALLVGLLIVTAPSPPLINVTGTVYDNSGLPAPGTPVTFSSISTQVTGGVEVPPTSFSALADSTGAISVSLPQGLRVNVVVGKGAPMAVTLPNQASIDLSALLGAVQVPPPTNLISSLTVASGGDYVLSVTNPTGQGAATLAPGNVTRINGNPVAALVPNPGQFLIGDAGGVAWEPFALSGDASSSAAVPGQINVNHFTLGSNASAGGFKLQNLGTPATAGDALSEGNPIGAITPAAGTFTSLTGSGTNGPALSNFNVNGAFNVKAYGAKGDANNDDTAAIQAAINAACAVSSNSASGATVYFPTGTYRHTAPLQLACSNITLAGAGPNSSTLSPAFGGGPAMMMVGPAYTGLETGGSLATGAGSAMLFDGTRYWLNLRDSAALDLNGLSAFTVEAFVKPTATNDGQIIASSGRFLASGQPTQAFSLQMVSSQLEGRLTLGGSTYILDSGSSNTLAINTVYHVAMSWDGSTIRLFINGTQVNSHAATGSIQQAITEDVTIGPSIYDWPDGTLLGNAINGLVDSVRISNVARYTANFTAPSAKFSVDSSTLGLLNFDQIQGPLVGMYTSGGLAWLPVRRTNEPSGASEIANTGAVLTGITIHDLGINADFGQNGIFATVTLNSAFDHLSINGTRNGLYLWNNCYQNGSHNVTINSSGTAALARIGLANISQSGVNQFDHLRVNGGPYPLVDYEGSMLLNMLDVAQQSNTVYGAFFKAAGDSTITLNAPILDVELGGTTWLGGIVFSSIGSAVVNGGELDSTNSAPAAIVDGGGSLSFLGNRMSLSGTPAAAIHVVTPPSQKIAIIEPMTIGLGTAPLSDLSSSTVTLNKDRLDNTTVNGVLNPQTFGQITGSSTTTTGSVSAGSNQLTVASISSFGLNQGIAVPGAGPTSTAATPAQPTATATCGSGPCSTTYTYEVVALDGACGTSAASPASASVSNAAALSKGVNYNVLSIAPVAGVYSWGIYRNNSLVGFTANSATLPSTVTDNFIDYGQSPLSGLPCVSNTPPSSATTTALYTTVTALNGSTLTLAATASNSVTNAGVYHADDQVIQGLINTLNPAIGGTVFLPPGTYTISSPILYGGIGIHVAGLNLFGAGEFGGATTLQPTSLMAGLPVIKLINATHCKVRDLFINGNTPAPPIAAIDSNVNNPGSGPAGDSIGFHTFSDLFIGSPSLASFVNGIQFTAAPNYDQNNEENTIERVDVANASNAALYIGHSNSLGNKIISGNLAASGIASVQTHGGSFDAIGAWLGAANDGYSYEVDMEPGYMFHGSSLTSCRSEGAGLLLYINANAGPSEGEQVFQIVDGDSNGNSGLTNEVVIDNEAPEVMLSVTGTHISEGIPGSWTLRGPAVFHGCRIGQSQINYNSNLTMIQNSYAAVPTTFTNLGSGTLNRIFETVGGSAALPFGAIQSAPVSTLPTCNASMADTLIPAFNNNAACSYGAAPAAGTTAVCPVFCDGTAWKIH